MYILYIQYIIHTIYYCISYYFVYNMLQLQNSMNTIVCNVLNNIYIVMLLTCGLKSQL